MHKLTPSDPPCIMADSGEVVTFAELAARSNQGAQLFRKIGLKTGDCSAIYMENNARYLEICWAANRCGVYYTCIATHLTAPEVGYIVADCDAKLFLTSKVKRTGTIELDKELSSGLLLYMVGAPATDYQSWQSCCAAMATTRIEDETEARAFLYWSGTTGALKV